MFLLSVSCAYLKNLSINHYKSPFPENAFKMHNITSKKKSSGNTGTPEGSLNYKNSEL
jgi:hypothetical protein